MFYPKRNCTGASVCLITGLGFREGTSWQRMDGLMADEWDERVGLAISRAGQVRIEPRVA